MSAPRKLSADMKDLAGQTIADRYHIQDFVGQSNLFQVYRAYDSRRSTFVALKFLRDDLATDPAFLHRFRHEAAVLKSLEHPHIVSCYGFEQTKDHAFFIMQYIPGTCLEKHLRQRGTALPLGQALLILQPVAAALHYAHQQGLCHGDVQPLNVLLESSGRVFLSDFGLVRWAEAAADAHLKFATPEYMAPEQHQNAKADQRTDIYALGIMLYEMLAGERPFQGKTAPISASLADKIHWEQTNALPPPLMERCPSCPLPVAEAISKALATEPTARPQTVSEFFRQVSGQELASSYSPSPELLMLLSTTPSAGASISGQSDLKQAAARLVAFLREDSAATKEGRREEVKAVVPVTQAAQPEAFLEAVPPSPPPPVSQPLPVEKRAAIISCTVLPREDKRVNELLRKAGSEFLNGRWDKVQMLCAEILQLSPNHAAAQVLASEATIAQRAQHLYEAAQDAIAKGETTQATNLLRQVLFVDGMHEDAKSLLRELSRT